ncbi:plasmid mobilization relaxosome protein MobC [Mucilaginibacter robiniae]|uniref:Plasmid mobilization relaxosome protein MobC n=1 Tax=Mucilaginibacter robiniae TaxID=2728022 RepID=A0A7L5E5Q1_9SPHI|nr:plasmid mobilization relaxosome protein MobC [Mucilaginibacter robiniae]QJD97717.1 plasmid mobilization relaxosome protein MobC [Mucilaginibacter robiniae]
MESAVKKVESTVVNPAPAGRVNRGGRPKVPHKRRATVSVMCTLVEKKIIEANAKRVGLSSSVFLRNLGLSTRIEVRVKSLPRPVLEMRGTLNHIAANLNQIAKKCNRGDDLDAMERALLDQDVRSLRGLVKNINGYVS